MAHFHCIGQKLLLIEELLQFMNSVERVQSREREKASRSKCALYITVKERGNDPSFKLPRPIPFSGQHKTIPKRNE